MTKLPSPEEGPEALRKYLEEVASKVPRKIKLVVTGVRSKFLLSGMEPSSFAERPEIDLTGRSAISMWQLKILDEPGGVAWDFIAKGDTASEVIRKTVDSFSEMAYMTPEEKSKLTPIYVVPITNEYFEAFRRSVQVGDEMDKELEKYGVFQVE